MTALSDIFIDKKIFGFSSWVQNLQFKMWEYPPPPPPPQPQDLYTFLVAEDGAITKWHNAEIYQNRGTYVTNQDQT